VNLLTLDLATRVGWTFGLVSDPRFKFGNHLLPSTGEDIGAFIKAFDDWLQQYAERVDYIVFEQPILPRETRIETLRKLYGLTAHVEFWAKAYEVKCREAPIGKIKMFMANSGNASKDMMVAAAKRHGYDVANDDEADAVGVRLYTISSEYPDLMKLFRLDLGPLGAVANV
jgi:hypothetical protein